MSFVSDKIVVNCARSKVLLEDVLLRKAALVASGRGRAIQLGSIMRSIWLSLKPTCWRQWILKVIQRLIVAKLKPLLHLRKGLGQVRVAQDLVLVAVEMVVRPSRVLRWGNQHSGAPDPSKKLCSHASTATISTISRTLMLVSSSKHCRHWSSWACKALARRLLPRDLPVLRLKLTTWRHLHLTTSSSEPTGIHRQALLPSSKWCNRCKLWPRNLQSRKTCSVSTLKSLMSSRRSLRRRWASRASSLDSLQTCARRSSQEWPLRHPRLKILHLLLLSNTLDSHSLVPSCLTRPPHHLLLSIIIIPQPLQTLLPILLITILIIISSRPRSWKIVLVIAVNISSHLRIVVVIIVATQIVALSTCCKVKLIQAFQRRTALSGNRVVRTIVMFSSTAVGTMKCQCPKMTPGSISQTVRSKRIGHRIKSKWS